MAYLFVLMTLVVNSVMGLFAPLWGIDLVKTENDLMLVDEYQDYWDEVIAEVEAGNYVKHFHWSYKLWEMGQCYIVEIDGLECHIPVLDYNDIKDGKGILPPPEEQTLRNRFLEVVPGGESIANMFYFYTFQIPGMPTFIPVIFGVMNGMCLFVLARMIRGND